MNRIIKFRAKTTVVGDWVYGWLVPQLDFAPHSDRLVMTNEFIICRKIGNDGCWLSDRVDKDTIGQFTSLYDKNGKEIYEGDILKAGDARSWIEVRFVRGVFAFLWNGNLDDECPTQSPTTEWAEVIGNIHDNKVLLHK